MLQVNEYPQAIAVLLRDLPLAPLGPGTPVTECKSRLAALSDQDFAIVRSRQLIQACRAGLWLGYGFLDESHAISQELETAEGSYWHALMHRREPDYANSKYWWRRVGKHPVFALIGPEVAARGIAVPEYASALAKDWDPPAFVDLCERFAVAGSEGHEFCVRLQRVEWELLFGWCYGKVVA